jgi:hypothetical protein
VFVVAELKFISEPGPTRDVRTEAECIEALREAAEQLGESLTKAQYEELGLTPASGTIQRVMGGWNEAKEVAGLETYCSHGSRIQSKPEHVTLPAGAEWNELTQYQRWHYKNREYNAKRTLERRARLREWVYARKEESQGCKECSEANPACLDFHHLDEEQKRMDVTDMVRNGYSKERLREEIAQCVLLCANCHWKVHHATVVDQLPEESENRTKEERLRAWTYDYKAERGCQRCDESDPVCLQFHHVDEKRMGVGRMIAHSRPEAEIRAEVDRCTILCANCHRKEHHSAVDEGENDYSTGRDNT